MILEAHCLDLSACAEEEEPEAAVVKAMEPAVVHRKTSKLKRHRCTARDCACAVAKFSICSCQSAKHPYPFPGATLFADLPAGCQPLGDQFTMPFGLVVAINGHDLVKKANS